MLVQGWAVGATSELAGGAPLQSWRTRPQRDLSAPGQDRFGCGRDIAKGAMRAHGVEVLPPALDQDLRFA